MSWCDSFKILGFHIDSKLKNLEINFKLVKEKIRNIISTWKPYNLSLRGRITIAKVKLVSQIDSAPPASGLTLQVMDLI